MAVRVSPVARVLTEPCLILGVEKPFAIANLTLAMVLAGELHLLAFLPVSLLVHLVLRQATRGDPFTRQVYIRYNLQADHYDPWIRPQLQQGAVRAAGLGSALC
jgi:type IV secretory pathway TrbD component